VFQRADTFVLPLELEKSIGPALKKGSQLFNKSADKYLTISGRCALVGTRLRKSKAISSRERLARRSARRLAEDGVTRELSARGG
jgi:hypothetical protein